MPEEAHEFKTTTSPDTTGLEDFFSSDDKPRQELVSLEEAAKRLNLSERTIQRRLKHGRLRGYKVSGPRGPEWRVDVSSSVDETTTVFSASEDTTVFTVDTTVSSEDRTQDNETALNRLASFYESKIEKLEIKLETAVWKNGYLEAQLSETENQIKLLPDYQLKAARAVELEEQITELEAKAKTAEELGAEVKKLEAELSSLRQGWWHRFGSWFMGFK